MKSIDFSTGKDKQRFLKASCPHANGLRLRAQTRHATRSNVAKRKRRDLFLAIQLDLLLVAVSGRAVHH